MSKNKNKNPNSAKPGPTENQKPQNNPDSQNKGNNQRAK